MSNDGLSYGLNISKKSTTSKPQPAKRKTIFDTDSDSEGESKGIALEVEEIGEFGGLSTKPSLPKPTRSKLGQQQPNGPPKLSSKKAPLINTLGDLSSSVTSKKHAETASTFDPTIYEFDSIYDSFKPTKAAVPTDPLDRAPKYMKNLLSAAAVRKRDATIAEEKKLAREREAEGDEFADKEKFVTSAYKRQQEENRRLEAEEKVREAEEERKSKGKGMTSFYKSLLEKQEARHEEVVKAVEERIREGPVAEETDAEKEREKQKSETELAREINDAKKGNTIAINDEGQVVDKRLLLKGGLNITPKPKAVPTQTTKPTSLPDHRRGGIAGASNSKQAMRERQTRMLEAQLEQASKRALDLEEGEREVVERAAKSRKTEGEIVGAKERYLARKREAEEAKKEKGKGGDKLG